MPDYAPHSLPDGAVPSARRIVAYFRKTGTLPKTPSLADEEKDLGQALARIRLLNRRGQLEQAASRVLDKACPGSADRHAFHSGRLWQERRDELIAWIQANGRPPYAASGDAAERALAGWIATYRRHARHGRHPERIRELDERIPLWCQPPVWVPKAP
ncbi:hypothetical protein [Arthrobacter sp. M4]|uniref:hypothetical protein n=1 Tax=Arthrobacter sp. M4 TaxID=218160 RepID=UPI001CDC70A8|nr:hypothetical protein [Arthrobacter sp. M4]MCA4135653.1 hypothetical protein [Arthrobacter sp. M4]